MWFYVQQVLVGHQEAYAAQNGIPRGNLSDLYPRWLGARELLLHHRDPYSSQITREIQIGYWGRALDPTRPTDPKDQAGFAYPAFVVFLLAPTIALPFSVVQTGFRWFLLILTAATVPLWSRALRWCPSVTTTATLIVLTLGSFQAVQGIKVQQLGLLVGGLVAGSATLLAQRMLAFAGVLLAFATIKPQLVLLLLVWLLLWAFSDWRRRRNFVWGFVSTMAILLAAAEYVLPGWVWRFRDAVSAYRQYNDGAESVLDMLITPAWGRPLAGLAVLALAALCWKFRRASADSSAFRFMLALVLAVTVVIVPKAAPYNQVLLLPGILLLVREWGTLWPKSGRMRVIFMICGLLIFWPWLAAVALTIAWLFLPARSVQNAWAVPLWTILAIPPTVVVLLVSVLGKVANEPLAKQPGPAFDPPSL
ncbi:MAG TPA: glycosyltransferase 87 family protein [Terriglobales bacterium]|nr:glycosyltransferase 87 family protein [Terriglobales bacterium]